MNEEFEVSELLAKDVDTVVNLVRTSFKKSYIIPSIYRGEGINKFILNELENEFSPYKYFVLYINNKVVAYTEYKMFKKQNMAFLNIISVSNEYKNQRIGSRIFEYSKKYFQKKRFQSIELDVYSTNLLAVDWYSKYGFKKLNFKIFYELELNRSSENKNSIYIKNFPQYKEMKKIFGFYFIDISIQDKDIKIGVIENDLFIRGNYDESVNSHLIYISKALEIRKIYYIGNEYQFSELKFIDQIERMGLNIEL
ncbi:Acetyltransferase (GNAT) family protein [Tenacibaculum sp. MAR_2010_89]|uniref:GNAT family N-acetyltransferase n=1 Tax=Tenacibaculum sp. MAR_2010_89 TaxID=1250198 RepID=UPI00089BEC69|nr:GNAT family N-acetyltransferase [Tenacibaculum sp. MAR_2010_89]SED67595.1 Acetyltransferase (GNAT) family protein [Tenacibaculum sp. MAR_2010_89]